MANQSSTADCRKPSNGPHAALLVVLACAAVLLCLLMAYFVARGQSRHIVPLQRTQNRVADVTIRA